MEALKNVICVVNKLQTERKMNITLNDINTENPEISHLLCKAEILKIEDLFGQSKQVFVSIIYGLDTRIHSCCHLIL